MGAKHQVTWDDVKWKRHCYIVNKWSHLCKLVGGFLNCLRNGQEVKKFERFLRTRGSIRMPENTSSRKGAKEAVVYQQLPNSLIFWKLVDKIRQEMMDCLVRHRKRRAELIPAAGYDQDYFNRRAAAIIELFIQSNIGVRRKIDLPEADGAKIALAFKTGGASVSLFHAPFLRLFPILFYNWRQYRDTDARLLATCKTSEDLNSANREMIGDIPHPGCLTPVVDRRVPADVIPVWIDPAVLPCQDPVLTQPQSPRLAKVPIMHRPPKGSPDLTVVGRLEANEQIIKFNFVNGTYNYLPLAPEERQRRVDERLVLRSLKEKSDELEKEKARLDKSERMLSVKTALDTNLRAKHTEDGGDRVKDVKKSSTSSRAFKSTGACNKILSKPATPKEFHLRNAHGDGAASTLELKKHPPVTPRLAPGIAIQEANKIKPLELRQKFKKMPIGTHVQDHKGTKLPFLLDPSVPLFPHHLQLPPYQVDPRQPNSAQLNKAFALDKNSAPDHPIDGFWYETFINDKQDKSLKEETEKLLARQTESQVQPHDPHLPKRPSDFTTSLAQMRKKSAKTIWEISQSERERMDGLTKTAAEIMSEDKPEVLSIADPAFVMIFRDSKPRGSCKKVTFPKGQKNINPAIQAVAGKLLSWSERSKNKVKEHQMNKLQPKTKKSTTENLIKKISMARIQENKKSSEKKVREMQKREASVFVLRGKSSSTDKLLPVKSGELEMDARDVDIYTAKVSALVEQLHFTRKLKLVDSKAHPEKHKGDSLEAAAEGILQMYQDLPLSIEAATSQVFGSAGRGKPPITSALFGFENARPRAALATSSVHSFASEASRASDTFSQKIRLFTYKDGNPEVSRGRVTTPDILETQKRNKKKKKQR